jgi:hypothetical protein
MSGYLSPVLPIRKTGMSSNKQAKKAATRHRVQPEAAANPALQIPRPRVTDRVYVAAVPQLVAGVPTGAVGGSLGDYKITLVLGVPGISSVSTAMDIPHLLASGDSLLEGDGLDIDLQGANGCGRLIAAILPNNEHHLAQVKLTVLAKNFADAERMALDHISTVLSRIAFQADTAIEISAVVSEEKASQIVHAAVTVIGSVQPAPTAAVEGWATEELGPFLAAYREGLNNPNAPLYQALSFYKILEGAPAFHKTRSRAAKKAAVAPPPDPFDAVIPADVSELPNDTSDHDAFLPYAGLSFAAVTEQVKETIRATGRDLVFDYKSTSIGKQKSTPAKAVWFGGVPICPHTPTHLLEGAALLAKKTSRADKRHGRELMDQVVPFQFQTKEHPKEPGGSYRIQCPAAGPSPTVTCPWAEERENRGRPDRKPMPAVTIDLTDPRKLRTTPLAMPRVQPPETPFDDRPICCKRATSTVPPDSNPKYRQTYLHGSTAWHKRYSVVRALNEGGNGSVKSIDLDVADAKVRLPRGRVAQTLLLGIQLMMANLRQIRVWGWGNGDELDDAPVTAAGEGEIPTPIGTGDALEPVERPPR